jgi:Putative adhesin
MTMYTFETPEPIVVDVELGVGDVRIVAGDRVDTTVEVRPRDGSKKSDVAAAEQTRVEYSGGQLVVKAPKGWRQFAFWNGGESIDVQIDLPAGSQVRGDGAVATVQSTGRLGECHFKTAAGSIHIAEAGAVQLKTSVGDITVDRAGGDVDIATSSGAVRLERVDGTAVVRNSNGDTWIGEVTGDLRANSANGSIRVDHARGMVVAKTANGDVRLHEVAHGSVQAETACGRVEIGVVDGVAAWLDLKTQFGKVRNGLHDAAEPEAGDDTVEVRARTSFGDITVSRSSR